MADTYTIDDQGRASIVKDPDATLDYTFDWTAWLDALPDSITSAEAVVDGCTAVRTDVLGKQVTIWVSGGVEGETATVTCRITTAHNPPRIEDRTIYLKIKER